MKLRRAASAAAIGVLIAAVGPTGAQALTTRTVEGPVVASDQHQDGSPIGWSRVAASGARLAVVETTDGAHYANPWFATDYRDARDAHLVRGSFAVARPALPVVATALEQADFYLARLGSGTTTSRTLPPALDLETTGGLSRGQLVTWAQTFLLRVRSRTGRVPLLRTYSYFWQAGLGDAQAFARYPLWIETAGALPEQPTALWSYAGAARVPGIATRTSMTKVTADDASWALLRDGRFSSPWPAAAPGAPQRPQARAGDGAAVVSWLPGDAGSSGPTAYHVTADPGGAAATVPGDATQATIGGLANGTAYTFTITAENAEGTGAASAPTSAVTPRQTSGSVFRPVPRTPRSAYTHDCMPPSSLVHGTTWKRRHPAAGVTLQEGQHRDARGVVRMHVLRVDVKNPHLRFAPLMHHVADRSRLSSLASRRRLVAATNAGYFDMGSGAPINPLVVRGRPVFGPTVTSRAAGFTPSGLLQSAAVAATGTVTAHGDPVPLAGWNAAQPAEGVNVYSARWGRHRAPMPHGAVRRFVARGVISSGPSRWPTTPPRTGYLLVASGSVAVGWLKSLHRGDSVAVRVGLTSSKRTPFTLAYAVGSRLVRNGEAVTGMSCKRTERLPARTAIGWAADRRHLILVAIDRKPRTRLHGVEPDQMARIMRDLGADEAYLFDGGGSTEMVVRPRPGARLSIRNYPSDGRERRIPLGFGIFRRP